MLEITIQINTRQINLKLICSSAEEIKSKQSCLVFPNFEKRNASVCFQATVRSGISLYFKDPRLLSLSGKTFLPPLAPLTCHQSPARGNASFPLFPRLSFNSGEHFCAYGLKKAQH